MAKNSAELPIELLGRTRIAPEEVDLSLLCPVPSPPWLTIPPHPQAEDEESEGEGDNNTYDSSMASFFNPNNKKVYFIENKNKKGWRLPSPKEAVCVGSSHGWLAFVDYKCVIYLTNPFKPPHDESNMIQLPPIETLPCIRGVVGSSSSGIDFMYWNSYMDKTYLAPSNVMYNYFVTKLVLSSPPSSSSSYTVMVIYGELNQLAFCKSGDKSWTTLDGQLKYNDDLYYSSRNQQFQVLCQQTGSFEVWDLSNFTSPNPKSTCIIKLPAVPRVPPSMSTNEQKMYLAELDGDLLFVVRYIATTVNLDGQIIDDDNAPRHTYVEGRLTYVDALPYKTLCFHVYKLDSVKKHWVQVHCLGEDGDGVLFLGINNPVAFSSRDFPGLKGNSIYFTDDFLYNYGYVISERCAYGGHDLGIFCLEDNSIHPCYYPGNFNKISPPPVWICPNPALKDMVKSCWFRSNL